MRLDEMPQYEFRCESCGTTVLSPSRDARPCRCGGLLRRHYSFAFSRPMAEHFNHAVGQPVSSRRQFADALKAKSEEMTLRTGTEHNYVPIDPTDAKALGVTDEGLDATRRQAVSEGKAETKRYM